MNIIIHAEEAARHIQKLLTPGKRMMLGITGIPGSGKSTLAGRLEACLPARTVPMDGFHLSNNELRHRGLTARKGSPETFDVKGFLACLETLKSSPHRTVFCPGYCRSLHEPVADQIEVTPEHQVIIVEGNYLLLHEGLWVHVREHLDMVCYLDTPIETAIKRVALRHQLKNISQEEIAQKIQNTDIPNARLIEQTRYRADWIIMD